MSYDHHEKAGNQGDIVKHPALIAALNNTAARSTNSVFRYADTFAAYAFNPLIAGNQWEKGIRLVAGQHLLEGNKHVRVWAQRYSLERPPTAGAVYPGSTVIARDVLAHSGKQAALSMWDISPAALDDLGQTFSTQGHNIYDRPAEPGEPSIKAADFIFIDPPDKSHWDRIKEFLTQLSSGQSILIWLPVNADTTTKPPGEDKLSTTCREESLALPGFGTSKVRWARGGHTIGCQMLYRLGDEAAAALREAIDDVVKHARWTSEDGLLGATHFT